MGRRDLSQPQLGEAVVGGRAKVETQGRLLGGLEDRDLQIEAAKPGVLQDLATLRAASDILPRPDRRELGATLEQLERRLEELRWRFSSAPRVEM